QQGEKIVMTKGQERSVPEQARQKGAYQDGAHLIQIPAETEQRGRREHEAGAKKGGAAAIPGQAQQGTTAQDRQEEWSQYGDEVDDIRAAGVELRRPACPAAARTKGTWAS